MTQMRQPRAAAAARVTVPKVACISVLALALSGCASLGSGVESRSADWPVYGGGPSGQRFSPLTQITPANVSRLERAWKVETGEGGLQTSPLAVEGRVFVNQPDLTVLALDAATGRELWRFAPSPGGRQPSRGFTWWRDGAEQRLFVGAMNRLWALDPATGQPIPGFGENGSVNLRAGLREPADAQSVALTTPGVTYKDLIIVGFRTAETPPAAPGAVRAYDVRTGALRWTFFTIPRPGEFGAETWPADAHLWAGGANAWAGLALDEQRGIVYAPTGSAVPDFVGLDRPGDNFGANTLFALDAATGRRLWSFQAVRHDLWDMDFPSPPVLATLRRNGRKVDAVIQATKQGYVFVFDRVTGAPLFPIEDRPALASPIPGERASPAQPHAVQPAPFVRQTLTADMLTHRTPGANAWARSAFARLNYQGMFTPLGLDRRTLVVPGFDGGAEWGGQAIDPRTGVLYVNANDVAWTGGLSPTKAVSLGLGASVYQAQCAACHGADRAGAPPEFPSLVGIASRKSSADIMAITRMGSGRMPAFAGMNADEFNALMAYVRSDGAEQASDRAEMTTSASPARLPAYTFSGYGKFNDPEGYPGVAPPWGTLNAIDLNTGDYLWKRPLGVYPELAATGLTDTGSENYGGPVLTAGGVLFIGATIFDRKLRAIDPSSGATLAEFDLPYAGVATPITYMADGQQFVLIAASGARDPKGPKGSAYVAFALPDGRGATATDRARR